MPRARSRHDAAPSISSRRRRRPPARPSSRAWPRLLMLEGTFSEAERLARDAIRVARACDPPARRWELHATTTLGVSLGWRADPEAALAILTEARAMAEELGDLDELFRVHANLTTVLELAGRHEEAVEVASAGIAAAKDAGLEAVYGNILRGNAADSLFLLGRWEEARAMSMTALEWLPTGINFLNALVSLATVEIELSAGEARRTAPRPDAAGARGRPRCAAGRPAPSRLGLVRAVAGRPGRCAPRRPSVGWALVRETEDWILAARTAAAAIEVEAAGAAEAREGRDLAGLASARERAREVIRAAEAIVKKHGVDPALGSRRLADAWLATARAYRRRVDGRDDPAAWTRRRRRLGIAPYPVRDGPRPMARGRGDPRLGCRSRRTSRCRGAAPRGGRDRRSARCPAAPARASRARRPCADRAACRGRCCASLAPTTARASSSGSWPGAPRSLPSRRRAPTPTARAIARSSSTRSAQPASDADAAARHVRSQWPRARSARPDRSWADEPRDRRAALHQPEDRRRPRRQHPVQARRVRAGSRRPRWRSASGSPRVERTGPRTKTRPGGRSPGLDEDDRRPAMSGERDAMSVVALATFARPRGRWDHQRRAATSTRAMAMIGPRVTARCQARSMRFRFIWAWAPDFPVVHRSRTRLGKVEASRDMVPGQSGRWYWAGTSPLVLVGTRPTPTR